MRLQNLRDRLYSRQSDIESRKPQTDTYDPRAKAQEGTAEQKSENKDWVIETGTTKRQKTLLLLVTFIIGGIILVTGGGYLLYTVLKKDFRQQQVQVKIDIQPAVNLNEDTVFTVTYANNNPVGLKNTHLVVELPPTFQVSSTNPQADVANRSSIDWNIGQLDPQKTGSMEVHGRFVEREGDSSNFKAILRYTPSNFNSEFENPTTASTRVIGVPLTLSIEASRTVASGYSVQYKLIIRNNGKEPFQQTQVNLTYPQGFTFINSSTPLDGDSKNVWKLPTILSGEEKTLTIDGKLDGVLGENKILTASLGKVDDTGLKEYIKKEAVTNITEPPVVIKQEIKGPQASGVVHTGDTLDFEITYTNKSDRGIGQAVVKAKLEGDVFNFKSVRSDDGGWFDQNNKEIVWQANKVPGLTMLNPGDTGKLHFTVQVPERIEFSQNKKSNFSGKTTVSIDSPQMPTAIGSDKVIIGNALDLKLSSKVFLKVTGFYNDGTLPNKGPVPPTVGKQTTYTIHWEVSNLFNDLQGVEVKTNLPLIQTKANLPSEVEWMNKVFPSPKGVQYLDRTKEISWNLERIPAGTGIDTPVLSLVFQVGLTPGDNDLGKTMDLLSDTTLQGIDTFTNEKIQIKASGVTTALPDDTSINEDLGRVIKPGDDQFLNTPQNDSSQSSQGE